MERREDRVRCDNRAWATLVVTAGERRVLDARMPDATGPLPLLDPEGTDRAVRTGRPAVSGVVSDGRWAPEPVVVLRVPVPSAAPGGEPMTLEAVLPALQVAAVLRDQVPGPDWRIAAMDGAGLMVARSASADALDPAVGRPPHESVASAIAASAGGYLEAVTVDGLLFDGHALRSEMLGWTFITGRCGTARLGPVPWPLVTVVAGALLAGAMAATLASHVGRVHARREAAERHAAALIDAGGRPAWLRSVARARREPDGSVRTDGVLLDVTAQRDAEAALRLEGERLRLALEAARLGAFEWDVGRDALAWSDEHRAIFGIAPGEPVDADAFWSRVHPEDEARVRSALGAALDPGADGEYAARYRAVRDDGTLRWISARGRVLFADAPSAWSAWSRT